MFNDKKGLNIGMLGLGVVGEVMLILFVSVVITASANTQLLRNDALAPSGGAEAPVIGLEITIGPGALVRVDGDSATLKQALERAGKLPEKEKIQVQMKIDGDPRLFWKLRVELKKLGCPYVEAAPTGEAADGKER